MRLAHLARDVGEIDFCYQAAGTGTFEGPVLGRGRRLADAGAPEAGAEPEAGADAEAGAADADAPDASTEPFIDFRTVSRYLVLDAAGPLTLAIVEAGAASCTSPILVG